MKGITRKYGWMGRFETEGKKQTKQRENSAERVVSHYRPRLGHQRQANVRRPLPDCLDAHASARVYQSAWKSTEGNYNLISFSLHYCGNLSIPLYANETRTHTQRSLDWGRILNCRMLSQCKHDKRRLKE